MSDFLAEARIIVRPDTSSFRADLEAQLRAVTTTPIAIPVVAAVAPNVGAAAAKSEAAFVSTQAAVAATQEMAAVSERATVSVSRLATAQNAAAAASRKLALAQGEVVGASSAVSAAQITLTRSTAAVVSAQAAVNKALLSGNAELIAAQQQTLRLAVAQEAEAKTALDAARAQSAHAASLAQLSRGGGASLLTLFGLRGATLAASGAFLAGTAAVVGFTKAVKSAADLERELNVFEANASATADQMKRVRAEALALGRDITLPGVTAGKAAETMTTLAKAGISVQSSIDGARGALQLATAANIDVAESAQIVAGTLNAFGLAGRDAAKVADLLAGASKESQGSIEDLALGLQQVQGTARSFGVTVEDTVTALTILTRTGLSARQAGTGLNVALIRLASNKAAQKFVTDLGLKIRDFNGNIRPELFAEMGAAMKGMSKEAQQAGIATAFGRDAMKSILPLLQAGTDEWNKTAAATGEAGLAQQLSAAQTKGLTGDIENLSNQASGLGLTIGDVAKGPLSDFVKTLADSVKTMNEAATGLVELGKLFGDFSAKVDETIGPLGFIDDHLGDIASASVKFGPVLGPFTALAGVAKQFGLNAEEAGKKGKVFGEIADSITESVKALTNALKESAAELRQGLPTGEGFNVKQVQNIVGGFDAEEVRARISENTQQILDVLFREQDFLESQLQREYVKRRPALKRALEQQLLGVNNDINAIQDQQEAEQDKQKKTAEDLAKQKQQTLLTTFGLDRQAAQLRIEDAAETAGLKDDIKRQLELRDLVLRQIEAVKKRISVENGRREAVLALKAVLNQVDAAVKSLIEQQRQQREQQRAELLQGISLDVELAQITDNQVAEVNARNRKLAVLRKALKREGEEHGKNSVEYKEIRNQIAAETAAINAIRKEKQQQNNSFAQASFEFLQAQQGFASRLLGNLIPRGATGGLVGGTQAQVSTALTPVAGAAEARLSSGPTAGQGNTTNAILQRILDQLKLLNGGQAAPEAQYQWRTQRNTMDGVGGG